MESLTMFVVVRKDLVKLGWPMGALMAQACHACTSAMWQFKDTDRMKEYASDLANMHKVTLEIKNQSQLETLSKALSESKIEHVLWVEQPENIPTAIATNAYRKTEVGDLFKKCQLFK